MNSFVKRFSTGVLLLAFGIMGTTFADTIVLEDFSTGDNYTVTLGAEGTDGTFDYFFRTDGTDIGISYTGADGYFFAAQDIDDSGWTGSASPSELQWSSIDISGYSDLVFNADFASAATEKIDNSDYAIVQYRIDSGAWVNLLAFENDGTQYNTLFLEDTDFDGDGDGTPLTSTFSTFSKNIAETGSSMDIRITVAANSGGEDIAFDNFEVTGVSTVVSVAFISADPALTESNLDGAEVDIQLSDVLFADGTLDGANFTLNNAPAGVTVGGVTHLTDNNATLSLAYDGTDFDADVTDFSITIAAAELTGTGDLTSNNLTITSVTEEPANHVTGFDTVIVADLGAKLEWTDNNDANDPADGFLLEAYPSESGESSFTPADGDDEPANTNSIFAFVDPGVETYVFADLSPNTQYTFRIWPHAGSGTSVDYKTDGTVPSLTAVTDEAHMTIGSETFDTDLGDMTAVSVAGVNVWEQSSGAAQANGYGGGDPEEDWLVSPEINLDNYSDEILIFDTRYGYSDPDANNYLKLYYTTDYTTPDASIWTELPFEQPPVQWSSWTSSGIVDVSGIEGSAVVIAFKYYSTDSPAQWNVDNIYLTGVPLFSATAPETGTYAATDVTYNSAVLHGWADANFADATVTFEYGETTSYGNSVTAAESPVTGDDSVNVSAYLTGLESEATYHYRIKASNSEDTVYGEDVSFTTPVAPDIPRVFFSEYIEGSGNNKALEIYNAGADTVDLNMFRIAQSSNGGGWAYYHSFPADTVLADGDVWVILNDGTNSTLYSAEDADEFLSYPSVVHHNGNDARGLEWTPDSGDTWILIDVIGTPDADPGSGWDVAGESGATANHTLVRKIGVAAGNTDWTSAAGTGAANSEWVVFPEDDFDHLGWHSEAPEPFSVLNPVHGDTISSFDDPLITDQDIGGETVKTLFVNWNKAVDPDPGDTLSYELMISNIYTGGGGPDEPIVTRDTAVFIPLEQEEPWKMNGTYQLYVNACDLTRHVTHSDSVTLTLDFKAPPEIVSADIVLLDGVPKFYAEFNMPIVRDMENYTLIDYSDGGTLLDPTAIDSVAPNAVFLSGDLSEDHWVAMEYSGVVACSDTASTPLTVTDTAWVSNEVLIPFSAAHPEDAAKVIEDFEEGIGSFWTPTGSGSTYGVLESSGFAVSDEAAFEGNKSGKLTLLDDPENNGGWYVRLYHQLGHSVKADSKIMLMVKGSNANVEMRISVKDEAGYEQGPWKSVSLSEDDWQVVSFDLLNDDAEGWVNGDGEFTGETGLIEAIHMRCPEDEDVTLYLDGFTERQILTPVDITLNVIMKKQVADGIFNPASDYVDVTGTFNEWSGTYMGDLDSDTTYTVTIPMMKYSTQEFKFRINGSEDDETVEFPSGGDNRVINVRDYDRSYTYWYNDDTLEVAIDGIPDAFALHQNYPNPFNPTTTINFDLPEASDVKLVIYDISGRKIRTLVDGNNIDAGYKRIVWNGRNDYGNAVSTGMYIYRLQAGAFVDVKKMTFLK